MSELAMSAKCRHCARVFAGPTLAIVGKRVDLVNNRLIQFMEKLSAHLETHTQVKNDVESRTLEFKGWRMLQEYETTDRNLTTQFDVYRWCLLQQTLGASFSDQDIETWVGQVIPDFITLAQMGDKDTLARNLVGMLQSMRDRLEEPGRYKFQPAEPVLSGKPA